MNESMESFANRRDREERYRPMLPRDREDRERAYFREDVQTLPLLQRNTNYPRVRQRSPVGYEDMDRVPQGGGMPFSDRRGLGSNMLRSIPDVGSADSGFQINEREPRTKYGERSMTRDMRFRIANNSQPMSSSSSDKLPPRGPGSNLNTHRDYIPMNNSNPYYRDYPSNRYHDNRDVRGRGSSHRDYRDPNNYRNIPSPLDRDAHDYRDRDYTRPRHMRDWDSKDNIYYRGNNLAPQYFDRNNDLGEYKHDILRDESGDSEKGSRYLSGATRHNHWRARDSLQVRKSRSWSDSSSNSESPGRSAYHQNRSTKTSSTRSVSPHAISSTGNSRSSSPQRPDMERTPSGHILKITLTSMSDKPNDELEYSKNRDDCEEVEITADGRESKTNEASIITVDDEDEIDHEVTLTKTNSEADNDFIEEQDPGGNDAVSTSGASCNDRGGWTGWRSPEQKDAGIDAKEEASDNMSEQPMDIESVASSSEKSQDMDLATDEEEQAGESSYSSKQRKNYSSNDVGQMNNQNSNSYFLGDVKSSAENKRLSIGKENDIGSDTSKAEISVSNKENKNLSENEAALLENIEEPDNKSSTVSDFNSKRNNAQLPAEQDSVFEKNAKTQEDGETNGEENIESVYKEEGVGTQGEKKGHSVDDLTTLSEAIGNLDLQIRKEEAFLQVLLHEMDVEQYERQIEEHHDTDFVPKTSGHESSSLHTLSDEADNTQYDLSDAGSVEDHVYSFQRQISPINRPSRKIEPLHIRIYEQNQALLRQNGAQNGSESYRIFKRSEEYPFFFNNIRKHEKLREAMIMTLREKKETVTDKEMTLKLQYKALYEAWKRKVDKMNEKKIENDQTAPVSTLRGNRRGDTVRSDAEMFEIIKRIESAESRNPELRAQRTLATIPPMILDANEYNKQNVDDKCILVTDPYTFYGIGVEAEGIWKPEEIDAFKQAYSEFPKKFSRIADAIGTKTAAQCILFYYRNKKKVDFKSLINGRNGRSRRRGAGRRKAANLGPTIELTTRKRPKTQTLEDTGSGEKTVYENGLLKRKEREGKGLKGLQETAEDARYLLTVTIKKYGDDFRTVAMTTGQSEEACREFYYNEYLKQDINESNNNEAAIDEVIIEEETSAPSRKPKTTRRRRIKGSKTDEISDKDKEKTRGSKRKSVRTRKDQAKDEMQVDVSSVASSNNEGRRASGKGDDKLPPKRVQHSSYWSTAEREMFRAYLRKFGCTWERIADALKTKTAQQVKNYYKKEYENNRLVAEGERIEDRNDFSRLKENGVISNEKLPRDVWSLDTSGQISQSADGKQSYEYRWSHGKYNGPSMDHRQSIQPDIRRSSVSGSSVINVLASPPQAKRRIADLLNPSEETSESDIGWFSVSAEELTNNKRLKPHTTVDLTVDDNSATTRRNISINSVCWTVSSKPQPEITYPENIADAIATSSNASSYATDTSHYPSASI
ncbi:5383_t:CDS:2 [Paraglomus occultum]|uniref:5383_t:CDS:1 n=1 Tax=Paraglomus occultum TaxID=144539 RepID=A0A9N9CUI2_9GLOM|nr:5383_t:CDS:2 [Paraglomus occultum]